MLQEQSHDSGQLDAVPDLQKIHSAGKHLQSLIDDILDLSKIEAGKMELFVEPFDVSILVDEVVTTIRPLVEKNGNTLRVECPIAIGFIRADVTKVRQILFNLLSNACKFTEYGEVRLEVVRRHEEAGDYVSFRVADTGIGMTAEQSLRLFQDFTQVDASTTRKYGGTGLGLAISRRFCEMMGGSITVESALGAGSLFTLTLPARIDQSLAEPRAAAVLDEADSERATNATVLVIDDDPIVHDLLTRVLSKEGFRIVCAANGEDGLRLAEVHSPAAITLDVMMPGMDGWSVLAALKARPDLSHIPIVMVTMTDDRSMGYALGASDYLVKPIDPGRLSALLNRHARGTSPSTVLVVDDDPAMRELARRTLQADGWRVREAADGRAALQCIAAERPDLVVLDLMMPTLDGFAFLTELRAMPSGDSLPVVVVTARDVSDADRQRLNGHVRRILRKGAYDRSQLLSAVRQQVVDSLQWQHVTP
jgi:DNA-binding response OmpR family regulator